MKENYLNKLRCVGCQSEKLVLHSLNSEAEEIIEGIIMCANCAMTYPIVQSLPCFLFPELRSNEIKKLEKKYLAMLLQNGS